MQGIIYIDILIFVNFVVDYFLLKITAFFSGCKARTWRNLLAALVSAAFSVAILFPTLHFLLLALIKIVCAALTVLVGFGFGSIRRLLKNTVYYFIASMLFAGLIYALGAFSGSAALVVNNMSFYLDISPGFLIVAILACYLLLCLFGLLFKRPAEKHELFDIELELFGKTERLRAFLDTGNRLVDAVSGSGVVVVDRKLAGRVLPQPQHQLLMAYEQQGVAGIAAAKDARGVRVVPFNSMQKQGLALGFAATNCRRANKPSARAQDAVVVFSELAAAEGAQAVIGPDLFN